MEIEAEGTDAVTDWEQVPPVRQAQLLQQFGLFQERSGIPLTCPLEEKNRLFTCWLSQFGIGFSA